MDLEALDQQIMALGQHVGVLVRCLPMEPSSFWRLHLAQARLLQASVALVQARQALWCDFPSYGQEGPHGP